MSLKRFFSTSSKAEEKRDSSSSKGSTNYKSVDKDGQAVSFWSDLSTVASKESVVEVRVSAGGKQSVQFPVRLSMDARHGGEMPECESISYEGWCIDRRSCRGCEDYWKGRTSSV